MTDKYIPQDIEAKWQKTWDEVGLYATKQDPARPNSTS